MEVMNAESQSRSQVMGTVVSSDESSLRLCASAFIRRAGRPIIRPLRATARITRNTIMRTLCRADYQRWGSSHGLEQWWDQRTQQLAALIPPNSHVIEFGAGRRSLEAMLPAGCVYVPSDLVDRGPGTIVCDLNLRPLPSLREVKPQVAVFSGVLEYIRDVPGVVQWLADCPVQMCVTSYEAVPAGCSGLRRMRENFRRSYYGYMSGLTELEFLAAFQQAGFTCEKKQTWTSQGIYQFTRRA